MLLTSNGTARSGDRVRAVRSPSIVPDMGMGLGGRIILGDCVAALNDLQRDSEEGAIATEALHQLARIQRTQRAPL
mgnify:CR=1 FL=1